MPYEVHAKVNGSAFADLAGKLGVGHGHEGRISSCRTWMKSIVPARWRAPITPLMPSPG
jgi:hypothetical protein